MQKSTRNAIIILNGITTSLDNLNKLGIYLAKQNNIDALQVLKLLILASETKKISKPFDINSENKYMYFNPESRVEQIRKENIIDNLSVNPHFFALELMGYIIKNYPINLNFEPYYTDNSCTIFNNWIHSFIATGYDNADLKIEIIDFMITNRLLSQSQMAELLHIYDTCIKEKNIFTKEQLLRMQNIIYKTKGYAVGFMTENYNTPNISIYDNCLEHANKELQNYQITSSACDYMFYDVYELIKQKKFR